MELNVSQREAVLFRDGPCMVLAGPGSGKTTVIARRAVTLTETYGIPENGILVVTFTKAAAEEMKQRYLALSGKESTGITFGTFHAVFYAILREEYRLPPNAVATDGEKRKLVLEAIREAGRTEETDSDLLQTVLSGISAVKNHGLDPESFDAGLRTVPFGRVFRLYEKRRTERGLLDFDDMLTMTLDLFRKQPETLEKWRERFRYFMVDEFQDVNPVQYEAVRLLAAPRNHLFIVGDDDQSVYGFRGARPEVMLRFPKAYPKAKKILLDVNYRSGREIVERSLALIGHNRDRFPKKLRAARKGGSVTVREFMTETLEYEAIAAEIAALLKDGLPPAEIAVLFRTNAGASGLLQKLMEHSVPFVTRDRVPNVFQHFVCRPVFALFNFLAGNRTRRNFFLFMNCPWRGFRREDFRSETVDLEELEARYDRAEGGRFTAGKIRAFRQQITFLSTLKTPFAMLHFFRNYMGYDRYVRENAAKRNPPAEDLIPVLDEVQASARPFDTVEAWYQYVAKYSAELKAASEAERKAPKNAVTVSTMHSAKGLEYRYVWIADVNERVIPHEKSKKPEEIEEERRLFYVGMTRAAETLSLCYAKNRFGRESQPSRFLKELRG